MVGFLPWGPGDPEPTNADAFRDDIASGTTVVEFWSARCNACRRIAPWLAQWKQTHGHTARMLTVHVDEEMDAAVDAKVFVAPTLIAYRDGQEIDRIEGPVERDILMRWLQTLSGAEPAP